MIIIDKNPTADTRTCDYTKVTKEELYQASARHIEDVGEALRFFCDKLQDAITNHDPDKLSNIDEFHRDFLTGFKNTTWWDAHRRSNRHHLNMEDGVPTDVNLIDVLDYIADNVMAGMARSGTVRPLEIFPGLLERAFMNTVTLLHMQVKVSDVAKTSL